MVSVEPFQVW